MNEFDTIFSSAQATAVFYLISGISLSATTLIAFSAWVRREWAALPARRRAPHAAAWRAARERF
jgi:hypothetical protein